MRPLGKKSSGAPTPRAAAGGAGFSIRKQLFLMAIVAALLIPVPPLVMSWRLGGDLENFANQQAGTSAQMFASGFENWVERQIATAELVAKDDELVRLFQTGSPTAWDEKARSLGFLFPESIRVRLLPPGLSQEDLTASPPITFAAIDMVRAAETTDAQPPMEVHASGTPQQHINLVRRVLDTSGKRIVGHIMVSFPIQDLQQILQRFSTSGFIELQQAVGGSILPLSRKVNRN